MNRTLVFFVAFVLFVVISPSGKECFAEKPNILIITVDDMNADSIGAYGCKLPGTTPNIDKLSKSSLNFSHAHVQVGNCMPSRNVMWSGLYPHNNRVEGFYQVKDAKYPTLTTLMKQAGYFTAIRNKVTHSTPYNPYPWDQVLDVLEDGSKAHVKDAKSYGESTRRGIKAAEKAGKPFCLMVNIADPHKPFYAQGRNGTTIKDKFVPSKVFSASQVPIPGFLFDDPVVRKELAMYYSSVRRSDDAVGGVLEALDASGQADNTVVMFLSDHGMPFPFAKTQLYHHSTHTPLMVRWPGVTKPNSRESTHMVSAVDFLPTLLEIVGAKALAKKTDGRSFASIVKGEAQSNRDFVVKVYNENSGASRDPMRAIQTRKFLYLFNPWSNGTRVFATATTGTQTYKRMAKLAETNSFLKKRLHLYKHRVVEELYDVEKDPDCLVNLIDSDEHQAELKKLRSQLESWMVATNDHALNSFRKRDDAEFIEAYVLSKEKEAIARRQANRKNQNRSPKKKRKLISMQVPKSGQLGSSFAVTVTYKVPKGLGEQMVHVTLKGGRQAKRIERKVIKISGSGSTQVKFELPEKIMDNQIRFAAFVGNSYQENIQHISSDVVTVE